MPANRGFVTGDKELDALFRDLPTKLAKKYMRKATRDATKEVLGEFKARVPVETGALRDVAKARAVKRSRTQVGSMVHIDRDKLRDKREARGGRLGQDTKRKESFFYAVSVEFDPEGRKPLRTALYDSEADIRQKVLDQVRQMIHDHKIDTATVS